MKPPARFDIRPYTGALPVTFGMHRVDVQRLLGPPESGGPIWNKSGFSEHYLRGTFNIGYDNAWLANHVGLGPGSIELTIDGASIWTSEHQPDPNPTFLALDPAPVEHVGFWAFL